MFDPDIPIQNLRNDRLGRRAFAEAVADAILAYEEKESLAIGLYGPWGSGKTSIINMALDHIKSKNESGCKAIIVRFDPWNFSDQGQLFAQFFKRLSTELNNADSLPAARVIGAAIAVYGSHFAPLSELLMYSSHSHPWAWLAGLTKPLGETLGNLSKKWAESKEADLTSQKEKIVSQLQKQSFRIVVIIDDIDRLNDTEIRQIFQLVKSLGNFPNTTYVLAFDRGIVIKALNETQRDLGAEYFEKVIQLPFEIPIMQSSASKTILFEEIKQFSSSLKNDTWDQRRWENMYLSELAALFKTIRDIKRYINVVRFEFPIVRDCVDPVDFLTITALQVFVPEVLTGVKNNKDVFAGLLDSDRSQKKEFELRCEEVIGRAEEQLREPVKRVLTRIFPKLENYYHNKGYDEGFLRRWRKEARVCSPDAFDVYFQFALTDGDVRKSEIEAVLSRAYREDEFATALLGFSSDGRIGRFLERFADYIDDIEWQSIQSIVNVIVDIGDTFPNESRSLFGMPLLVRRVLYRLIMRFDNQEARFNLVRNAVAKPTRSVLTLVDLIGRFSHEHGRAGSREVVGEEQRAVSAWQLNELEKLAVWHIDNWAEDGRLAKSPYLITILLYWRHWGEGEKVKEYVAKQIATDAGLVAFISLFLSTSYGWYDTDYVPNVETHLDVESIKSFIDVTKAVERLEAFRTTSTYENLDDRARQAIDLLLENPQGADPSTL